MSATLSNKLIRHPLKICNKIKKYHEQISQHVILQKRCHEQILIMPYNNIKSIDHNLNQGLPYNLKQYETGIMYWSKHGLICRLFPFLAIRAKSSNKCHIAPIITFYPFHRTLLLLMPLLLLWDVTCLFVVVEGRGPPVHCCPNP